MRRWMLFCIVIGALTGCGTEPAVDESDVAPISTEVGDVATGEVPTHVGNVIITNRTELEAFARL